MMTSDSATQKITLFKLQEVTWLGDRRYRIKLSKGERVVVAEFNIKPFKIRDGEYIDLIQFSENCEEYGELSMKGEIYGKLIGKVIFAFDHCVHENFDSVLPKSDRNHD